MHRTLINLLEVAERILRAEIERALDAQQEFFQQHRRFARTLDELGWVADSTVSLRLVAVSDSSITISGNWSGMPEVTCALEATPSTRGVDDTDCGR
jgi:hypothetical protein